MSPDVPAWVTLTGGESVVWSGGPSLVVLLERLLGEAVLVVAGLWLVVDGPGRLLGVEVPDLAATPVDTSVAVGAALAFLGLVLAAGTYLRFRAVEYLATTEELYVKRGLVSRSVTNLRLDRVQDSGFSQSATQRFFGYGDVFVSTAGGGGVELSFRNVPDPAQVNGIVTQQLDRARGHDGDSG